MTTNNHPAHGPVSLDRLHQIREHLQHDTQYSNGGNRAYILADVLKVIDEAISAFGSEPVAWRWFHLNQWHVTNDEERARDLSWDSVKVTPLYAAPPAPVVPTFDEWLAIRGDKPLGWVKDAMRESYDACRAAMLQAGNHSEQHLDMVDHSGDTNKNVDPVSKPYKLSFDEWLSQQDGEIDVDCGCVMTEVLFHWMRVAYEAGNSPVIPDGWIPVSERMPDKYDFDIWVFSPSKGIHDGIQCDGCEFADDEYQFKINDVSHWMKKIYPAAPQQEVKP